MLLCWSLEMKHRGVSDAEARITLRQRPSQILGGSPPSWSLTTPISSFPILHWVLFYSFILHTLFLHIFIIF